MSNAQQYSLPEWSLMYHFSSQKIMSTSKPPELAAYLLVIMKCLNMLG
jgi:hypothetical protein